ncbi:MAG TPA: chemotaxis protein CheW [Rhodocyclaceae bacterium]|jgi:twitching motility protein PilI|nr:chemotaxis protein CheW [Rhodocyclaceae bacterium]
MAKRLSLRDFQENLSARLQSAQRGETVPPMLGFRAGQRRWLLELPDSGEVVPLPTLSSVPLTKAWFAGMANIRGALHAVADFAQFAGSTPTARTDRSRLLLIGARHGTNSALLVESIEGLRPMSALRNADMPSDAPKAAWIDAAYQDEQGNMWLHIALAELLQDPGFLDIAL